VYDPNTCQNGSKTTLENWAGIPMSTQSLKLRFEPLEFEFESLELQFKPLEFGNKA